MQNDKQVNILMILQYCDLKVVRKEKFLGHYFVKVAKNFINKL